MRSRKFIAVLAVVDKETVITEEINHVREKIDDFELKKKQAKPCELYVCNLPRSSDIADLVEMFKPFGSVLSVEVSRNPETGVSRGCGYITMGSVESARNAVSALDGSDVGGREMRVRYSVEISSGRRNPEALNSAPTKHLFYESPHKLYVGNLPWSTKPDELRNLFNHFGIVVSARVLSDRKGGKNRTYAFLSFLSDAERDAALSMNGTEFYDRMLVVKRGVEKRPSSY